MLNELYPESKQSKFPFLVEQSQLDLEHSGQTSAHVQAME